MRVDTTERVPYPRQDESGQAGILWDSNLFSVMWDMSVRLKEKGLHHPILLRQELTFSGGIGVIFWTDGPSMERVERALEGLQRTVPGVSGHRLSVELRREYSQGAVDEARKAVRGPSGLPAGDLTSFMDATDFYSCSKAQAIARYGLKEVEGR